MKEKLDITYESIGDLYDDLKTRKQEYALATLTDKSLVTVTPMKEDNVFIPESVVFEILEDGTLKQKNIEAMEEKIIERLAKYIEPEKLLLEILRTLEPSQLVELHERAVEKEGKVTSGSGCYSLKIGGKRGTPFELYLGGLVGE